MSLFNNLQKYFVFSLIFVQFSSIIIYGNNSKAHHSSASDQKAADGSLIPKTGSTTLGELIVKEQKRQTLADLLKAEKRSREERENTPFLKRGETQFKELIEMEQISEGEMHEFVREMGENEQLIEEVFEQKKGKGLLQKIKKMFSRKKKKQKDLEDKMLEEKHQHLNNIKETDPAMTQIIERLQTYIAELKSGKLSEPLTKYLIFVIYFLAKRQQISISKIVPIEKMKTKKILAELVKLILEQKRENKQKKKEQNGDKKGGQNCQVPKNYKSNKNKEERMLRLLLTAVDNLNGNLNLAMEVGQSERKRRKKRFNGFLVMLALFLFICFVSILFMTIHFLQCSPEMMRKYKTRLIQRKILKALKKLPEHSVIESGGDECAICLNHFERAQKIRAIPPCQHKFHTDCIDKWVKQHNNCPICRAKTFKVSLLNKVKPNDEQEEEEQQIEGHHIEEDEYLEERQERELVEHNKEVRHEAQPQQHQQGQQEELSRMNQGEQEKNEVEQEEEEKQQGNHQEGHQGKQEEKQQGHHQEGHQGEQEEKQQGHHQEGHHGEQEEKQQGHHQEGQQQEHEEERLKHDKEGQGKERKEENHQKEKTMNILY